MSPDRLNATFAALADPTRRAILARLVSVSKHLKVLERAGLIARGREAQWRPCRLEAGPLKEVADWIEQYRQHWEQQLDRLDDYLRDLQRKEKDGGEGGD
jgi:DNA-binding transcriptional ArsR family regulator